MPWTKDQVVTEAESRMKSGQLWVFVETNSTQSPFIQGKILSEIFLNAAVLLPNGNQGCILGFEDTKSQEAKDFVDSLKKRSDVVSVEGPKVK